MEPQFVQVLAVVAYAPFHLHLSALTFCTKNIHTHIMHVITSSTRIPPPTPPPIAAATEDEVEVGFVAIKSIE